MPGNRLTPFKAKELFREYLKEAGYSETTIKGRLSYLRLLFTYLPDRKDLRDVRPEDIRNFIVYLRMAASKVTGNPYGPKTIEMVVSSVRLFFRCLYVKERILTNPTRVISPTVSSVGSTKEIFSEAEISRFLDSIDLFSYQGKRDRAIFELMYSSGLRGGEVSTLDCHDIDLENRMLLIRHGKGGKDRIVPVSEVAAAFLKAYLAGRAGRDGPLFLGEKGRLGGAAINKRLIKRLREEGMYRKGLTAH